MSQEDAKRETFSPIRQTTPEAVRLARTLIRTANFGALAVLDPASGFPLVSRVAVATDNAGMPILLISDLSAHAKALAADKRCSLLLGEPGKGDPVAHPRVTLICNAERLGRNAPETALIRQRFLRRQPKSALYIDFADFAFVRLQSISANLNGGFGKAFVLDKLMLANEPSALPAPNHDESKILAAINQSEAAQLNAIGKRAFPTIKHSWQAIGVDGEGIDLAADNAYIRVWFDDLDPDRQALTKQIQWLSNF